MFGEVLLPVVFPPGNLIVVLSGSEHVHIAVAVNICGISIGGFVQITRYGMLGEVLLAVVFPPGNRSIGVISGSEHVHIAISVYICGINRKSTFEITCYGMLGELDLCKADLHSHGNECECQ